MPTPHIDLRTARPPDAFRAVRVAATLVLVGSLYVCSSGASYLRD